MAAILPSTRFRLSSMPGNGAEPHATIALGYQLESTTFVFCSPTNQQFLPENFLRDAGFDSSPRLPPSRTSKKPLDDFGSSGGSIRLAHAPPIPLFSTEPEISESRGAVHGCRENRLPPKTIA